MFIIIIIYHYFSLPFPTHIHKYRHFLLKKWRWRAYCMEMYGIVFARFYHVNKCLFRTSINSDTSQDFQENTARFPAFFLFCMFKGLLKIQIPNYSSSRGEKRGAPVLI